MPCRSQYDLKGDLAARCRGGVLAEHLHCRSQASLFDVSHMGQAMLTGTAAAAALERLVPGDIIGLKPNRQRYTLLTNEAGGILDDLMVANLGPDKLFLVVNASRKEDDFTHLATNLPAGVKLAPVADRALLALQGPAAVPALARLAPEVAALPFMGVATIDIAGVPCLVSRSGYTGEDGCRDFGPRRTCRGAGRCADRPAGSGARRPRRPRFAAAGSRAVPVRQRHRRAYLAGRSRPHLGDRQAAPRSVGLSGSGGHP